MGDLVNGNTPKLGWNRWDAENGQYLRNDARQDQGYYELTEVADALSIDTKISDLG